MAISITNEKKIPAFIAMTYLLWLFRILPITNKNWTSLEFVKSGFHCSAHLVAYLPSLFSLLVVNLQCISSMI